MTRRPWRLLASATAAAALLAPAAPAGADPNYGFGIDSVMFKPSLDPNGFFALERPAGLKAGEFGLKFGVGFAQEPLQVDTIAGTAGDEAIFDYQLQFDFGVSFGLTDKLTFGFQIPLITQPLGPGYGQDGLYRPGDPELPGTSVGTGFFSTREEMNVEPAENMPGDLRIGFKYGILDGATKLALQVVTFLPFGDEDVFTGSGSFTVEPKAILELGLGKKGRLGINAGVRIREGELAETREVDDMGQLVANSQFLPKLFVGTEASVGVGALFDISPSLAFGAETMLLVPILKADEADCGGDCKNGDLAGEALLGAIFGLGGDKKLTVGAGTAIIPGAARSAGFRVFAMVSWAPTLEGARVGKRGDADGDGLPDGQDICPDEPEDNDDFQDDDGCPELDNDLDGVLDAQDKCANEPEDRDGYDDGDGCPEGDNDKDGVADLTDRCPGEAEDPDGFDDDDGCPDEDNDGDGVLDAKDRCPDQPETVNGYEDTDGCPDQKVQTGPKLTATRIDLQGDRVEFVGKSAKLTKASESVLDAVAAEIKKAPPGTRFRIEVGVEQSGAGNKKSKAADLKLSQQRADAVYNYLRGQGISVQQLDKVGVGSDRPLDPQDPKSAKNRRVEFIRLNQP